jgi:hypothetical protein
MFIDNAVELMLHQIAQDKAVDRKSMAWRREEYAHQAALNKALGKAFDAKVKFAKIEGGLSEDVARTIAIMHGFRNEVYHVGVRHETILPALALFYFDVVCEYLGTYKVRRLGWGSNQKMPERAKKYFAEPNPLLMPGGFDEFGKGCETLRQQCRHDPALTIATLADHMDEVISQQDTCIQVISDGVYEGQQTTRDVAVLDTQAWRLAFSEEGKAFAAERGWSGTLPQLIQWLTENFPLSIRSDPIPSWQAQANRLRTNKNPHIALANYQSFMTATADIREAIEESAGAAEQEIEAAIDRAREK